MQGDPLFLLKKSETEKTAVVSEEQILRQVVAENLHETEIEKRHCYSLYIGKCMKNGIEVQRDAAQFYEYIRFFSEEETA